MRIVKQENQKNYVERDNWYAVQLADMALQYIDEFDDVEDEIKAIRDLYNAATSMNIQDEFEIACHFLGVPLHRRTKAYGVTESQHVGEIGQRQQFDVTVTSIISLTSVRGTTNFHKFVDDNGNRLIWFASNAKLERGRRYSGWAIVKKHGVYNGVRETMLTRCAFKQPEQNTPLCEDATEYKPRCQSKNHRVPEDCYGTLWQCWVCGRWICCQEGSTNRPDLCDECWHLEENSQKDNHKENL